MAIGRSVAAPRVVNARRAALAVVASVRHAALAVAASVRRAALVVAAASVRHVVKMAAAAVRSVPMAISQRAISVIGQPGALAIVRPVAAASVRAAILATSQPAALATGRPVRSATSRSAVRVPIVRSAPMKIAAPPVATSARRRGARQAAVPVASRLSQNPIRVGANRPLAASHRSVDVLRVAGRALVAVQAGRGLKVAVQPAVVPRVGVRVAIGPVVVAVGRAVAVPVVVAQAAVLRVASRARRSGRAANRCALSPVNFAASH